MRDGAPVQRVSQNGTKMSLQDVALRTLVVVAGALAAVLLALKGHAEALPALAAGATLGALMMAPFNATEE
jgi:hypothetical protein